MLLTNADRVSPELYNDAVRALIINVKCSTDYDSIAESVLLCLLERKLKSTTEEDIFREISATLAREVRQRNHPAVWGLVFIVKEVYRVHPQMIVHHLAVIVRLLLQYNNRVVEKDTRDWLRNEILVQDMLAKPYILDPVRLLDHKIYAMKELHGALGNILNNAILKSISSSGYEYIIDAYQDCGTYLYLVSSNLDPELEEWLKSEAPATEAGTELDTVVQELFDEVNGIDEVLRTHENLRDQLRDWQDEYSVSDAPSNSNVVEIDDGEFYLF